MSDFSLYFLGFGIIFVGVIVLIAATVLMSVLRSRNGKVKTSGVIVVGPIPIVFGSDRKSVKTLLELSVVLTALIIIAMFVYYFLLR